MNNLRRLQHAEPTQNTIRSWFYPGSNNGWEFVYPKSQRLEVASNTPPVEQPAPAPSVATAPEPQPTVTEVEVDEQVVVIAQNEEPALVPAPAEDALNTADRELTQTAGYFASELMAGVTMLGLGLLIVCARLRRSKA